MRMVYDLVPDLRPIILGARQLPYASQTLLDDYLPPTNVEEVEYRIGRVNRNDQTVPLRAFDTPAIPIARQGVREVRGGLPAMSAIDTLTETDLYRARRLAGLPVDLVPSVVSAAARTSQTIVNTMRQMAGAALFSGNLNLVGNGINQAVDFGLPASNRVAPATAWSSTAAATALDDLIAWRDAYITAAGGPPARMVTSTQGMRYFVRNTQIINATIGSQPGRTYAKLSDLNDPGGLLAELGLPPMETFDQVLGVTDPNTGLTTATRLTPANRLIFLPAGPVGQQQYGITEEAVSLRDQQVIPQAELAGITPVTYVEENPVQKSVASAALGMPVIRDPFVLLTAATY